MPAHRKGEDKRITGGDNMKKRRIKAKKVIKEEKLRKGVKKMRRESG